MASRSVRSPEDVAWGTAVARGEAMAVGGSGGGRRREAKEASAVGVTPRGYS